MSLVHWPRLSAKVSFFKDGGPYDLSCVVAWSGELEGGIHELEARVAAQEEERVRLTAELQQVCASGFLSDA